MQLDSENEWGFYIDPLTFEITNIEEEIPSGSFVVIKEREYIEDIDRTVIQTTYGIVVKNRFQPMNKRELSSYISKACAEFILTKNTFPPKIKLEKELLEGKPARLAFLMSSHDTFHLKITDKLLEDKDPVSIVSEIIENETSKLALYDKEEIWKVEYAKSSRSTCRTCGIKIEKERVRVGEPYYYEEHLSFRWHHEECIFWKTLNLEDIQGLDDLDSKDHDRILGYFQ